MKTAAEIMNRNFYHASQTDSIGAILREMSERGLGSVPVLDLSGRPLGSATMAHIERCYDVEELTERLQLPALCVNQQMPVEVAARTLGLHAADSLLLVDDNGVAVGALTALELLRVMLRIDAVQTESRRRLDEGWDAAELLELGAVHRASEAPGVILLASALEAGNPRILWAEGVENMRARLDEMLRTPQQDPRLESLLAVYPRTLRFQCLTVHDEAQRNELAFSLKWPSPSESGDPDQRAPGAICPVSLVVPKARVADVS
jgi:CBS domain-containing protein